MKQRGFVAISSVLVILVVVLTLSVSLAYLSIGEGQSSFALFKGEEALQLTEGCVEDVLLKARNNPNYNGGTLSRPEGTCNVTIDSKVGTTWVASIVVSTPNASYIRKIQVTFDRNPTGIVLSSWKEI